MGIMENKFFDSSKLNRILHLRKLGFNTPMFIEKISSIKELALFGKHWVGKRVSIRTQGVPSQVLCPHFPNALIDKKLLRGLSTLIRKKFELLIFEAINPDDADLKGNIWINKLSKTITIEYMEGPGTVRELESGSASSIIRTESPLSDLEEKEKKGKLFLGYPPSKFLNLPLENFILEFSVYNKPVGERNSEYIFWEIRKGA